MIRLPHALRKLRESAEYADLRGEQLNASSDYTGANRQLDIANECRLAIQLLESLAATVEGE